MTPRAAVLPLPFPYVSPRFSPDGRLMAAAGGERLSLWEHRHPPAGRP